MESLEARVHRFTVEKSKYLASATLPDGIYLNEPNLEAVMNETTGHLLRLATNFARGETTTETKTVNETRFIHTYASWWDNLKSDLRSSMLIPKWLKDRISVRYRPIEQTFSFVLPVSVTRACPHVDFGKDPRKHIAFLFPEEWAKQGLPEPPKPVVHEPGCPYCAYYRGQVTFTGNPALNIYSLGGYRPW